MQSIKQLRDGSPSMGFMTCLYIYFNDRLEALSECGRASGGPLHPTSLLPSVATPTPPTDELACSSVRAGSTTEVVLFTRLIRDKTTLNEF
jgi:hypothetical protein